MLIGTAAYTSPAHFSVLGEMFTAPYVQAATVDYTHMTEGDLLELIHRYAPVKHVKEKSVLRTMECEAWNNGDGTWDASAHSMIVKKDGTFEDSWGLSQIHLPDHPEVTRKQAQDPDFAARFMVDGFANGQEKMWTCWRDLKAAGKL